MLKRLWKKIGPNPFDRLLKKAAKDGCKTVLIPWNRGLGDIALGLYAMVKRVKDFIPEAKITFITREDLKDGFEMLHGVDVIVAPEWARGKPMPLPDHLPAFDLVIDKADPSYWVAWQRGKLIPKMEWNPEWDHLKDRFNLPTNCIAAHVHCETGYYFERNWPHDKWQELFSSLEGPIILLGLKKDPVFQHPNLIDLRGETSLYEILAILKNNCKALIAPDSGILGMTYFLNTPFRLRIISLWADPNHGILKQNVPSPNPLLEHIPMISSNRKDAALITVEQVKKALA
jgi:ADP-heptose:LPS heptosyltransferase